MKSAREERMSGESRVDAETSRFFERILLAAIPPLGCLFSFFLSFSPDTGHGTGALALTHKKNFP